MSIAKAHRDLLRSILPAYRPSKLAIGQDGIYNASIRGLQLSFLSITRNGESGDLSMRRNLPSCATGMGLDHHQQFPHPAESAPKWIKLTKDVGDCHYENINPKKEDASSNIPEKWSNSLE